MDYPITRPLRAFCREHGISPTLVYRWDDEGEVETLLVGNRRHIVVESYRRMIERRRAEQAGMKLPSSNPKAKARQAPAAPEEAVAERDREPRLMARVRSHAK